MIRESLLQELDDDALVSRCVTWDPGAWDAFVLRHGAFVQSEARRQLLRYSGRASLADVEDASQEVFSLLLKDGARTLRQFRHESSISTWLSCVVRSVCRQLSRRDRLAPFPAAELAAPEPASIEFHTEKLLETLGRLTPRDQRLLRLFFTEGKKYRQIAQELRISINSVGPLLSRAIGAAKRILAL